MTRRDSARILLLFTAILLSSLHLGILPSATPAQASPGEEVADPPQNQLAQFELEQPDDPPGEPARPVPGTPPSGPYRFHRFSAVQVNVDAGGANIPGDAANEPSIAVNPLEPNKMAIGWRQFDTVSSNFRQAGWAYTTDGGRNWTFPGVIDPGLFRSDPVLSFDSDGVFYYSSLGGSFLIDVFTSLDNGATWGPPVYAFGGDKQWIAVDRSGGIGEGNLYQAWSIAAGCCGDRIFTRSTDGVQTFEEPITLPNTPLWGTVDVAPNGTLYTTGVQPGNRSVFYAVQSTDAQDPLADPTFSYEVVDMGGSVVFSAGPNPGGLLGQVSIVADPSDGPTAGWVYMLASVDPDGIDPLDVHFALSWDGGVNWGPWTKINDDPPHANSWQWFGTMSAAPNGRIDVVWNDTRDSGVANISALYHASSSDGGITWTPDERLSDYYDSHVGWPNQSKMGDYYHMVSDNVGASLAWAATFNGEQDVYYLRIGDYDCNVNSVPDSVDIATGTSPDVNLNGIPDECEEGTSVAEAGVSGTPGGLTLHANLPNPFNPATTIRFETPVGDAHVRLRIYDAAGRQMRTLVDGPVADSSGEVVWDGRDDAGRRLVSGVYYCQLEADGQSATRTLVLLK